MAIYNKMLTGAKELKSVLMNTFKNSFKGGLLTTSKEATNKLYAESMNVSKSYINWVTRPEKGLINFRKYGLESVIKNSAWSGNISVGGLAKSFMTGADYRGWGGLKRVTSATGRVALIGGAGIIGIPRLINWTRKGLEQSVTGNPPPLSGGRLGVENNQLGPAAATITNLSVMNRRRNAMVYQQYRRGGRFI